MLRNVRTPFLYLAVLTLGTSLMLTRPIAVGAAPRARVPAAASDNLVLRWNAALLEAVRRSRFPPTLTARALAVVHTAMFDAWAAYHPTAIGVHWPSDLRRPEAERTPEAIDAGISLAAYRTLADLFPAQTPALFDPLAAELGLNTQDGTLDPATAVGIGNLVANSVLSFRHADGANQLGDLNGGAPYSDYTNYLPVNSPDQLVDPNRWQPLRSANGVVQTFLTPQWGRVLRFAISSSDQFRPPPPAQYPSNEYFHEVEDIRVMSARLTDQQKMIAEYWADGPATETPPGHWALLAQWVSRRDANTTGDDVVMFFALGNSLLDSSIAVWDCKVAYDYVRPVSAVRFLYAGQMIEAWGGPFQGTKLIRGEDFTSYIATPPFAEYTSGHSAFSGAAAETLKSFTANPHFGASVTLAKGTSAIEPGAVPASDVTLRWKTFDDAAEEAGLSRRLGGIHFRQGDLESRELGRRIARQVWAKTLDHLSGAPR